MKYSMALILMIISANPVLAGESSSRTPAAKALSQEGWGPIQKAFYDRENKFSVLSLPHQSERKLARKVLAPFGAIVNFETNFDSFSQRETIYLELSGGTLCKEYDDNWRGRESPPSTITYQCISKEGITVLDQAVPIRG